MGKLFTSVLLCYFTGEHKVSVFMATSTKKACWHGYNLLLVTDSWYGVDCSGNGDHQVRMRYS